MGLFDSVAGAVLGKIGGDKGMMVQVAMDLFNQYGGLEGVLAKFKSGGLAEQAASWVSKGENLPVTAEQISQLLGSSTMTDIATKLNMNTHEVSSSLAEYIPQIIDRMTPDGEVNARSGNLLATMLGMLK